MSDPRRWSDSGSDAPDELRRLIRAAPRTRPMSIAERNAMSVAVTGIARRTPVAITRWLAVKSWVVVAGFGSAITLAAVGASSRVHRAPSTAVASRSHDVALARSPVQPISLVFQPPVPILPSTPVAPTERFARLALPPAPRPAARAGRIDHAPVLRPTSPMPEPSLSTTPAPTTTPATDTPVAVARSSFDDGTVQTSAPTTESAARSAAAGHERAILNRARDLVSAGQATDALEVIAGYETQYPHGQMEIEGQLLAVDALRALGRTDEIRRRCEAMLAQPLAPFYATQFRRILDGVR